MLDQEKQVVNTAHTANPVYFMKISSACSKDEKLPGALSEIAQYVEQEVVRKTFVEPLF